MYERNIYFTKKLSRSVEVWVYKTIHLNWLIRSKDFRNYLWNHFSNSHTKAEFLEISKFSFFRKNHKNDN